MALLTTAQAARPRQPPHSKLVKLVVAFTTSASLLAGLLWRADLLALGVQLSHTHWGWALTRASVALVGVWTRARRWHYLFPLGSNPPALFRASMIGYMANNVLPLLAGELVRVVLAGWSLARSPVRSADGAASLTPACSPRHPDSLYGDHSVQ